MSDPIPNDSGAASVTTSATLIVGADSRRTLLVIQNNDGTSYIEVGGSSSMTRGLRIAAGDEREFYSDFNDKSVKNAFWAKAETGTIDVSYFVGRSDRFSQGS